MIWEASAKRWRECLLYYPTAISLYEEALVAKKKAGLSVLDEMMWSELGAAVASREPSHVSASEYRKVIEWKLKRGKWRPRLQKFADELPEDLIRKQSEVAMAELASGNLRVAVKHLVEMRGCGPATASAVLAACDSSVPFMSDELLEAIPVFKGQRTYTLPTYMKMVDEVRAKSDELGADWDARKVEQAAFVNAVVEKHGLQEQLRQFLSEQPQNGDGVDKTASPPDGDDQNRSPQADAEDDDDTPPPEGDNVDDDDKTLSPPSPPPKKKRKNPAAEVATRKSAWLGGQASRSAK